MLRGRRLTLPSMAKKVRRSASPAASKAIDVVNPDLEFDPFWRAWLSLTPAQRLRRSWAMRRRIKDLEAAHDEKSLPKL